MLNEYYIVPSYRIDLLKSNDNAMQEPIYSVNKEKMILKTKVNIFDSVDFQGLEKLTVEQLNVELQKIEWHE